MSHPSQTIISPINDDPVFELVDQECQRQKQWVGLIPSENHCSPQVLSVLGSCLNSKYSEGYPRRRYYEGNQYIDQIEELAQQRIKELFGVPYVNVQPYSGSPANSAIQFALMQPGDTVMGLALRVGGHLTHGHPKVTFSGKYFRSVQFEVNEQGRIEMSAVRELALAEKPQVMMIGTTAYPFTLDFAAFRKIADEVGAWLVADISHITGLVVAGEHPSPVPHADVIMSTTHKTFRGPRGAMIMVTDRGLARDPDLGKKIDSAIIPGLQGGPHNATTAAIALAAAEASTPEFRAYAKQITKNAQALAKALMKEGLTLVGDGTDNHLMVIDLSPFGPGLGTQVAYGLDLAGIYANRNTVPKETGSPFYPSGLRVGTPLVTSRGMKEEDMVSIARWISEVTKHIVAEYQLPADKKAWAKAVAAMRPLLEKDQKIQSVRAEVTAWAEAFPLFTWFK